MGDQEKKDSCCSATGASSGSCCCCKGGKKFIMGALIGILIFAGGFIFAKSNCPKSNKMCLMGMDGQKMCPLTGKPMGEMPAK